MKAKQTNSKLERTTAKVQEAGSKLIDKTKEVAVKVGHEIKHAAAHATHAVEEKLQEERIRASAVVEMTTSKVQHSRQEKEKKAADAASEVKEKTKHDADRLRN